MATHMNAKEFVQKLEAHRSPEELKKIQRYFKSGPRTALRYSIKHLEQEQQDHYLKMKKVG